MNDWPRHSLRLNMRNTSPSHVSKKQTASSVGGDKKFITVNKERNKRRKVSCAVSEKDNKKNM